MGSHFVKIFEHILWYEILLSNSHSNLNNHHSQNELIKKKQCGKTSTTLREREECEEKQFEKNMRKKIPFSATLGSFLFFVCVCFTFKNAALRNANKNQRLLCKAHHNGSKSLPRQLRKSSRIHEVKQSRTKELRENKG